MRTKAREVVFKLVYSSLFTGEVGQALKKSLFKFENLNDDDTAYAERVLSALSAHGGDIVRIIDEKSYSFPESRLFPVDKSILYVALAEILYMDDIPAAVSVNEAANLASQYSTEKSASFISGILAEVIKK